MFLVSPVVLCAQLQRNILQQCASGRSARCSAKEGSADTWTVHESPVAFAVLAEWTFRRRDDRLALRREQTDQGYQLVITESGRSRTFTFRDLERLVVFQKDMEDFLVRTGWSLAGFSPDWRNGGDRRGMPRDALDRRRWWTDVIRGEG